MLAGSFAKLNRSSRNAFCAAIIIIAVIAVYSQIVAPHVTYLFALRQYKSALDRTAAKRSVIENKVKINKKKLEELNGQFARFQNTLFVPQEAEEFFGNLRTLSLKTNCSIYSLDFIASAASPEDRQAEEASDIAAERAMLSVAGVYDNVIKLVESFQMQPRKVWIESLKMESLNDDSPQIKCDINIKIYSMRDKGGSSL